jgi:hypothetical protein
MPSTEHDDTSPSKPSTTYEQTNDSPAFRSDKAEVLRFLRERERELLDQVRQDVVDPQAHDAVSSDETAIRLGWLHSDASGRPRPQAERAARVLEQLCTEQKVVCFSRPRMRRGESGDIRLYCTAVHLEALCRVLQESESDVMMLSR